jgi:hypothetical protein
MNFTFRSMRSVGNHNPEAFDHVDVRSDRCIE